MAKIKFVSDEEVTKMRNMYEGGQTVEDIAKEMYVAISTVYKYLQLGKASKLNAQQIVDVNRMYEGGASIGEIMAKYDIHYQTARKAIKDYKVHERYFNNMDAVKELNRQYDEDKLTMKQLAKMYGVSIETISRSIWNPKRNRELGSI